MRASCVSGEISLCISHLSSFIRSLFISKPKRKTCLWRKHDSLRSTCYRTRMSCCRPTFVAYVPLWSDVGACSDPRRFLLSRRAFPKRSTHPVWKHSKRCVSLFRHVTLYSSSVDFEFASEAEPSTVAARLVWQTRYVSSVDRQCSDSDHCISSQIPLPLQLYALHRVFTLRLYNRLC
jgi:hypothetical protein